MTQVENKLYEFKHGEQAWSPFDGWHKCKDTEDDDGYGIEHGSNDYTLTGLFLMGDKAPSLLNIETAAKLGYVPPIPEETLVIVAKGILENSYKIDFYYNPDEEQYIATSPVFKDATGSGSTVAEASEHMVNALAMLKEVEDSK